jgi:hypothetical protein
MKAIDIATKIKTDCIIIEQVVESDILQNNTMKAVTHSWIQSDGKIVNVTAEIYMSDTGTLDDADFPYEKEQFATMEEALGYIVERTNVLVKKRLELRISLADKARQDLDSINEIGLFGELI